MGSRRGVPVPPPPYDPNRVANAMADQSAGLRARLERVEAALREVLDWTEPKVTTRMILYRLDVFRRARACLENPDSGERSG